MVKINFQHLDWNYSSTSEEGFASKPARFQGGQISAAGGGAAVVGPAMLPFVVNKAKMNKQFVENRLKLPNVTPLTIVHEIGAQALRYEFVEERGEKQLKEYVLKVSQVNLLHSFTLIRLRAGVLGMSF